MICSELFDNDNLFIINKDQTYEVENIPFIDFSQFINRSIMYSKYQISIKKRLDVSNYFLR
jgi:hypothetical protein